MCLIDASLVLESQAPMDVHRLKVAMVAEVLARLGATSPRRTDIDALVRASLEVRADDSEQVSLPALLQAAGAEAGAELWRLRLSCAELVRAVSRVGPVAALMPDGVRLAVIESGRFGRTRFQVFGPEGAEASRRVTTAELAGLLGLDGPEVPTDFLSRRPGFPLEALASARGANAPARPIARLWALSLLEFRDLRAALLYAIGISLLSLAVPLTVQLLISQALAGVLWQSAIILTVILVLTLGFRGLLEACETLLIEAVSRRFFVRMARDFASRIVRLGRTRPGDLAVRLAAHRVFDGSMVEKSLVNIAYDGFAGILTILATVTLLTIYHPLFALSAFIVIALATLIALAPARRGVGHAILESKAKHLLAIQIDHLGARPDMFAGRPAGDFALGEVEYLLGKWTTARQGNFRIYFRQIVGFIVVHVIASTSLLAIGAWLIHRGELTVGQLVAGELMMAAALTGVGRFARLLPKLYDVLASLDKVGQVLDLPERREGGIVLNGAPVAIGLGSEAERGAVRIEAGARAFIEGDPDLVEKVFRGLNEGDPSIRIEGRAASAYSNASLGERVIWVDVPYCLPGTLLSNLRMVDPDIGEEEALDLLTAVGLDLEGRQQGITAPVGPDGAGWSRADQIRLTIARAIASRPAILIIDGILDRLLPDERRALLETLAGPPTECPWTLLVASADPDVPRLLDVRVRLDAKEGFQVTAIPGDPCLSTARAAPESSARSPSAVSDAPRPRPHRTSSSFRPAMY